MRKNRKNRILIYILLGVLAFVAIIISSALGLSLSLTRNFQELEDMDVTKSVLPTQILDINGNLITEIYPPDEKRNLVTLNEVPDYLIHAVLTREDQDFYKHKGFNFKRILQAGVDILFGSYSGGASTITQQVAKLKFTNKEYSVKRKLIELWYALQLERRYTKDEILEFYINEISFGYGTSGVEAASQYYFSHSVKEITLAEAVILVNLQSNPTIYSPFKNPNLAKERQIYILNQMVKLGYVTREMADQSFDEYWLNYDYTRPPENVTSTTEDRAPWFSFYIQEQLNELLLGSEDVYKGGLKVYTTLNLELQEFAQAVMKSERDSINERYQASSNTTAKFADYNYTPLIGLLTLSFNIKDLRNAGQKQKEEAIKFYSTELNPIVDMMATNFNLEDTKKLAVESYKTKKKILSKTEVEGSLVTIDSTTGYIVTMVGGSKDFSSRTNMFNRAVDGSLPPGSAFKPLYYAAAIKSRRYTGATVLSDRPMVFYNDDGTVYTPMNYKGNWTPGGIVLLRTALAKSLNIPSLQIFEGVGYDLAIDQASRMLGIIDPAEIEKAFPRTISLGLGVNSVSPLQMARAYATFANEGKEVTPIAIRYIEDRNGNVILEPEKKLREKQKKMGKAIQLLTPQEDYIMVDIMREAISSGGTLAYATSSVGGFDFEIAGKTGTTQNWSDAWAIGYTKKFTTAVWFGFDTPGNSLGIALSGAAAAGPAWAQVMKKAHDNNKPEDFKPPSTGMVRVEVCELSGLLPDIHGSCQGHTYKQWFIKGTEPYETCTLHRKALEQDEKILNVVRDSVYLDLDNDLDLDINLDSLDPDAVQGFKLPEIKNKAPVPSSTKDDNLFDDTDSLFSNDSDFGLDLNDADNPLIN